MVIAIVSEGQAVARNERVDDCVTQCDRVTAAAHADGVAVGIVLPVPSAVVIASSPVLPPTKTLLESV